MMPADALANVLRWSLQVTIIVGTAAALPWLLRLDAAGVRYAYWRVVGLLCLALPWIQPYGQPRPNGPSAGTGVVDTVTSIGTVGGQTIPDSNWTGIVVIVLVAGVVLRLVWLGLGLYKLHRLRMSVAGAPSTSVDADWQPILSSRVDIRYVAALEQPLTFGVRKPIVLLPDTLRHLSSEIQRAVIGHELLHVQRRDWAWLVVEEVAVCLFWFHPAAWWVASRIQMAREEVVDELAILLTGRRRAYVEALLAFADATSVVPTAAFARRRHLFRRIALVSKEGVMSSRRIVASGMVMAFIVGAGSWYALSAFPLQATAGAGSPKQIGPGPLERTAHAVTPENPIPRRVGYAAPVLPAGVDATASGLVTLTLTIDNGGRVAESRVARLTVRAADYQVDLSGDQALRDVRDDAGVGARGASQSRETGRAFMDAAVAAVQQWRYDPPAEAPLAFNVTVRFGTPAQAAGDGALRVGGTIKSPTKVKDVRPVYPEEARAAHVSGVVILEVRIGPDGRVEEAHTLKSVPLLDQAAIDAVTQWEFTPTLLNGRPIPVIMTITINFSVV